MIRSLVAVAMLAALAGVSPAAMFDISFTGLDLVYDGSTIQDSNASGGDAVQVSMVAEGQPEESSVQTSATIDFFLPGVLDIDDAPNDQVQSAGGGTLVLTMPGGETVQLSLGSLTISYVDLSGIATFAFGAGVTDMMRPIDPTALSLDPPTSVSFSARIGALRTENGKVTQFVARSTGEIEGATIIPEPSTAVTAVGLMAVLASAAAAMRVRLG